MGASHLVSGVAALSRRDGGGRIPIEVNDTDGERLPLVRDAGTEEDCRRGLVLVAALAEEWGTAPCPGTPGRTV
ncbi:hypothetical protein NHG22_06515 [Streptomyces sp. ATE26]|uniref:hypothetical protein n=1 Tax=unclassified Streptomyces TaxID=2593676 RepID=UPI00117519C2|nr:MULTISPECIES: hypothetical protein [unclassified Streptomyces]MDI1453468.1 hypothetical protein [Streptomyces sp. ATE26]GEJ98261.1 hypothetical protein TNCT1_05380 [Streptomyces sp. 1-11]